MTWNGWAARAILGVLAASTFAAGAELRIRVSVGQQTPQEKPFHLRFLPASSSEKIDELHDLNGAGTISQDAWSTQAGAGKSASIALRLTYMADQETDAHPLHVMWADLINHSDPDTAARLSQDASNYNYFDGIKVLLGRTHPEGFTFMAHQLMREKALWIPAYDVFITLDQQPVSFSDHLRSLQPFAEKGILKRVQTSHEASYEEFASKWADMGDPTYVHPHQPPPGHIICLTWDSAIPKFGIDRGSGVWNDYGNPDHFRFWFGFGDLTQGIIKTWKSQRLDNGMPVVTTTFESDGIRYEVEQFAYPLDGPPPARKGDITVVLFQKVRLTNLTDVPRAVPISMTHSRVLPIQTGASIEAIPVEGGFLFRDNAKKGALFTLQGIQGVPEWHETTDYQSGDKRIARAVRFDVTIAENLASRQSREFVVKLPSPTVPENSAAKLIHLDYSQARAGTIQFWSQWVNKGARFHVPEEQVNDLFRASLWHALRLPRRHGATDALIDLPYSNFAYDQTGIPWPGVQSIYVDYMLYELRGYDSVALEELLQEFRRNQDRNGHISGFADWLMYTPSMLYASGQYYLLSHDRVGFERLLPYALKALEWCEDQCRRAEQRGRFPGLLVGPLNDGTGSGVWALNQAYFYAGLDRFGAALAEIHDPHASEVLASAARLRKAIQTGVEQAVSSAPLVQLRDHTWQPYVPSDAESPHRLMDIWYPTDVDVGPLHLIRLKALAADGSLANFLLNDHEDNLFLKGWGMANEPVYRPQGMAYLYRDDPKAAIRTFYSQMACAFSHTVFEPVEHRWMHGQYFGPPSTDGSWFELYRNLLLREIDDHTLILGQATPRPWLADGKNIEVDRAPTYFGNVSFHMASHAGSGTISAHIDLPSHPPALLVRLRHPKAKPIRSVTVNGKPWQDFDREKEWIHIPASAETRYDISVRY